VRNNWGKFTKKDLANIWDEQKYENAPDELLQLMIKFKLCYQIPNSRNTYLAPQLLTENQPVYNWDPDNNLILRYTYEFMPKGILTQFIVGMHRYIQQQEHVWKSGVILEKEQTLAEVIEYYGKREIRIRVSGKHKRDLLIIVNEELEEIHRSYQRLKYNKLIPCNCQRCKNNEDPYFYIYDELRERITYGETSIQCGKPPYNKNVNVLSLIDDTMGWQQFDTGHPKQLETETGDTVEINRQQLIEAEKKRTDEKKKSSIVEQKSNKNKLKLKITIPGLSLERDIEKRDIVVLWKKLVATFKGRGNRQ